MPIVESEYDHWENRTETVHKSEKITIKGNRDKTVKGKL